MARVMVVGAGVVGVASAWLMCRAGHDVMLVDRHAAPAQGASQANGAQLSYSYADSLASPSMIARLPAILSGRDPVFGLRLHADPEFLLWGLRFALNCAPWRFSRHTRHLLQMAADTQALLSELMHRLPLEFDHAPSGKMILYETARACEASAPLRELKRRMGIELRVLDRAEATALEPALAHYPDRIDRVVHSAHDAAGRPDLFCRGLVAALSQRYGLRTRFGQAVHALEVDRGRVLGVRFADGVSVASDAVVLCTAGQSALIPRRDRPFAGLWPVRGYSLTAPATDDAMRVSITDLKRKTVFARVGTNVRAAGLADIGPRESAFDASRFETFRNAAVEAASEGFDHGPGVDLQPWSGDRPCTPDSQPIVRRTSVSGLYLNLGHGALGWTLCLGAARRLEALMQP